MDRRVEPCRQWLKIYTDITENGVWSRQPDRDLWLWILVTAKRANADGTIRYSHAAARKGTAYSLGTRRVTYSDKQLRGALERLMRDGRVKGVEGAHRRAHGRDYGYFVLTICNFGSYQGKGTRQGVRQGEARGVEGADLVETETIETREIRSPESPSDSPTTAAGTPAEEEPRPKKARKVGDDIHSRMITAVWNAHEVAFGSKPTSSGPHWAKTLKILREKHGATLPEVEEAAVAYCQIVNRSGGSVKYNAAGFMDRFSVLRNGHAVKAGPRYLVASRDLPPLTGGTEED